MPLRIDILTLFPEMFAAVLGTSIPKRAAEKGLVEYHLTNIRDFATDAHQVGRRQAVRRRARDGHDVPDAVRRRRARRKTGPAARDADPAHARRAGVFDQQMAEELAAKERLLLIAGHYEGFDERIIEGL